jgi:hypothetical protein
LPLTKPTDWASILENNFVAHAATLEKWDKSAIGDITSNLGTPTGVATGRKSGWATQFWWDGIGVCLNIRRQRIVDVWVHGSHIIQGEWNSITLGCVDVVKSIECFIWLTAGLLLYDERKEWTAKRLGWGVDASHLMLPMRLWYASLHHSLAGELSSSKEGAMELIGMPDQYSVAVGVLFLVLREKLLTRFVTKPDWLRWTATVEEVMRQEKFTPRNHLTIPMKSTLQCSANNWLKRDSNVGSSKKQTRIANVEAKR